MELHDTLPTTGELSLEPWLTGAYYRICYEAENRRVRQDVHFHDGDQSVWGYSYTDIPDHILTLNSLLDYLVEHTHVQRLDAVTLRLCWKERGKTIILHQSQVTVGRQAMMDLTFPNVSWQKHLSRQHCIFVHENKQWYLKDSGCTNRPYVNGIPLIPGFCIPLKQGYVIRFVGTGDSFVFDVPEE